jgi:hypothetical protein
MRNLSPISLSALQTETPKTKAERRKQLRPASARAVLCAFCWMVDVRNLLRDFLINLETVEGYCLCVVNDKLYTSYKKFVFVTKEQGGRDIEILICILRKYFLFSEEKWIRTFFIDVIRLLNVTFCVSYI